MLVQCEDGTSSIAEEDMLQQLPVLGVPWARNERLGGAHLEDE